MAASPALYADDNGRPLATPQGFRPSGLAANTLSQTMTGTTAAYSLPTTGTGLRGQAMFRIVGTQPILYALGPAGQSASFTGLNSMIYVPAGVIDYFRADPTDTTIYVQQGGAAGTVQVNVLT